MSKFTLAAIVALIAAPAFADDTPTGDAAKGEQIFNRQCATCHVIQDDSGKVLAGRAAHIGPDLWHAMGRQPGTYPNFNYGDSMVAYGKTGVVWGHDNFVEYVQGPTPFLRKALGDNSARGKMAFQLRNATDAEDVYAFLYQYRTPAADAAASSN
ncbi:MAG: c-type cytochrome [Limimaricola sp.]|nr:c-type cytochrome [Limimaricola sp.]MBI1417134.1 c-type cytochrome [Limimaricola sp.]